MGETTMGIAHLGTCQGKSYSGPIRLNLEIMLHAAHCNNGLHPSLDPVEQTIMWIMTCAPLTVHEDLKVLLKEGLSKLCPPGIVPREYEALQFCPSPGETCTKSPYLLVGMSTLSGPHMRLRDVMVFQPDFLHESMRLISPWHDPPFQAPSASDAMDTHRDQRTPGEVATYLKSRFYSKPHQGKQVKELRCVTTCLTSEPTEDFAPKYTDWQACASLYVAIDILIHNDGIRHSDF
jgi:hypothetical protein